MQRPNGRINLDRAMHRLFPDDVEFAEMQGMIANAIVGQFLPDSVMKGGASLKMRYGNLATRVTTDFDASYRNTLERFVSEFRENLSQGWEGFTFDLVERERAHPKGVNPAYVMRPFEVKLSYNGKSWTTVYLELSTNELGDADAPEYSPPPADVLSALEKLGFPPTGRLPLMPLEHQIAQKLHGLTEESSERAHDLVDIQLICKRSVIDIGKVREIAAKLFRYRKMQTWPTLVVKHQDWDRLYAVASRKVPEVMSLDAAIAWVNETFICPLAS